jgi:hyperosmotically inducible protein
MMKTILIATTTLAIQMALGAPKDSKHNDAFIPGDKSENHIVQEVRHQLVMLPYYGVFDDIAFRVEGGKVTLLGQVTRPTLKSDAGNVAKRVEGVTEVDNQIEVLPLSPMDDQIRMAAYRAIYGDATLGTRYGYRAVPSIHIIVKNGHITLEGVVANQGDKNLIGIRTNGVRNAFGVINNLQVEGS